MDHISSWFQTALLPDRWSVAGVSCNALTVWHVFVLQQTENPYLCGGPCDRDAAASLLAFCSHDYASGKKLYTGPLARAALLKHITRKLASAEWTEIHAAVTDYLSTCSRVPGHKSPAAVSGAASSGRKAAAPLCWVLVDFLCHGNPAALSDAWDTPYAVAKCLFDARRDVSGDDDTLESSDEEKRFDAFLEKNP
jgi:hypothetical protein